MRQTYISLTASRDSSREFGVIIDLGGGNVILTENTGLGIVLYNTRTSTVILTGVHSQILMHAMVQQLTIINTAAAYM